MGLIVENLTKSFGNKCIFSGFSYSFPDTGLFLLQGESGVGKTTLLRIIAGLDRAYGGSVIGGGVKNVSFVFQEYRLFPNLSALKNVCEAAYQAPTYEDINRAKEMLMTLGFTENDMNLFPDELSGGMKQRVSIARAILKNAPILILDEPTKELDEKLRGKIMRLVEREATCRLVIMVTHTAEDLKGLSYTKIQLGAG